MVESRLSEISVGIDTRELIFDESQNLDPPIGNSHQMVAQKRRLGRK